MPSILKGLKIKELIYKYHSCYIYQNDLDSLSSNDFKHSLDEIDMKIITVPEEIDHLLAEGFDMSPYDMEVSAIKKRLSKGSLLFCAFNNERFVSGSWVGLNKKSRDNFYSFDFDYNYGACIGGTMTDPVYRKRGMSTYIHSEIFRYLKNIGKSKVTLEIDTANIAAQRSQEKLGSYVLGTGTHLRILFVFRISFVVCV